MKSALSIVAFSNSTEVRGSIALLETALDALDRAGLPMAAAYVDHALCLLQAEASDRFEDIPEAQ